MWAAQAAVRWSRTSRLLHAVTDNEQTIISTATVPPPGCKMKRSSMVVPLKAGCWNALVIVTVLLPLSRLAIDVPCYFALRAPLRIEANCWTGSPNTAAADSG